MSDENTPLSTGSAADRPFELSDRQRRIHSRLSALVSPGIAVFFRDACEHMGKRPPLETTTHTASNLLREVESALRDVLASVTSNNAADPNNAHQSQIRAILQALEIEESEPVAKAWLELPDRKTGLQKRTHRDNLAAPRPVDAKFIEFWEQMETILDVVLERFEGKYTKVFQTLDDLAKKQTPTKDDIRAFHLHTPNNRTAHHRFFSNLLLSKQWLEGLYNEGIFKTAPGIEHLPDSAYRFPDWPQLIYLKRMVESEPVLVATILPTIDTNDNAVVQGALLDIAATMPQSQRTALVPNIKLWLQTSHRMFLGIAGSALIVKFTEEGDVDTALDVAAAYLEILPDPTSSETVEDEHAYRPAPRPRTRIDDWQYSQFLKKEFRTVVEANPRKALDLLLKLLADYTTYHNAHTERGYRDLSYISRPAIEPHEQNHEHDEIEDGLISAVRDTALEVLKSDPTLLTELVPQLEEMKWTVFRRIALYLLSRYPAENAALVATYLTDESLFNDHDIKHEYSLLLGAGFPTLTDEQREEIFGWIDKCTEIEERIQGTRPPLSEKDAEEHRQSWRRDKLSIIAHHLTGDRKAAYDAMIASFGKAEYPDFASYSSSYVGPTSDTSPQALSDMETEELVTYLKSWEPKSDRFGFHPTKEGLGRDISQAVILKPSHFQSIATSFIGLSPNYVRGFLQGFHDIDIIEWDRILDLCEWVKTQPHQVKEISEKDRWEEDSDWGETKRTMGSMLSRGVQKNLIPFSLRERVWGLLEWLTEDPDPTTEREEKQRGGNYDTDPYTMTINSVRGEALDASMQYALWVTRELGKTDAGKSALDTGFDVMPEIRRVLEKHLDNAQDSSMAVRAVYGRYFPWIHMIDKKWATENLSKIFPPGQFSSPLYFAPWSAYIKYVSAFNDMIEPLQAQYLEAIRNLPEIRKDNRREDYDTPLIEHLMLYYTRGRISLSDPLMTTFWSEASAEMRGYALDYIGRMIGSRDQKDIPLPPEAQERLQTLWEARRTLAETATDKSGHSAEMGAFGWWFASGRFDPKWSSDQYLASLEIAGNKRHIDHMVAERLLETVGTLPVESIGILKKIVLTEQPAWILIGNSGDIRKVLESALVSTVPGAPEAATDLINRLAAHGYPDYGDLLSGSA